jgi:hypothetical protein
MNALERVLEVQKQNLFPRLGKGAGILGELYREGQRCLSGWSRICPCPEPTGFCLAKKKWIGLVEEYYGGMPFGLSGYEPFYVIEAMTVSQFRQSGLTATVEVPCGIVKDTSLGMRTTIRVGVHGTTWKTIVDLSDLQDDDAALAVGVDAVVKLQKAEFRK